MSQRKAVDRSRLRVCKRGFRFTPFRPRRGKPLGEAEIPGSTDLLVFERGDQRRALVLREMAYHHVAQGELAGMPYLVSF